MNNKPIAWIWSEDGCNMGVCLDQDKQIGKQEFQDYSIPLYTHPVKEYTPNQTLECSFDLAGFKPPVKELTDDVKDALMDALSGWKYIRQCHGDLYGVGWDRVQDKLEAILRKASEK